MSAEGRRFAIVVSRWNELITKELLDGALSELERYGAADVEIVHVPGTWEVPIAAAALAKKKPSAIIALGCILQGQTPHAQLLGGDVGSALMSLLFPRGYPSPGES
jgi:6,7-dimethyl-8-ribityllumazine synthase